MIRNASWPGAAQPAQVGVAVQAPGFGLGKGGVEGLQTGFGSTGCAGSPRPGISRTLLQIKQLISFQKTGGALAGIEIGY